MNVVRARDSPQIGIWKNPDAALSFEKQLAPDYLYDSSSNVGI
jgi:hypothetical protein